MTTNAPATGATQTLSTAQVASLAGTFAGLAAAWVGASVGLLYFDNSYGPFGEHGSLGALTALGCGAGAGIAVFCCTWAVARRSRLMLVVLLGVVCVVCWVLQPRPVDVSESWVPLPNPRWSCTGWSFEHYPPGVQDASSTRYCVGLENRIPNG